MRSINEVASGELVWVSTGQELSFELRAGEEVVGRLQLDASQRGDSDTADQRLTLKREGFLRPHVNIRVPGSQDNVGIFRTSWKKGGTLATDAGRQFRLRVPTLLKWQWTWTDIREKPLVHLKDEGTVIIEPDAAALKEVPLLIVLGWYLLVVWAQDAEE